jgi:hypothetical protein
VSRNLCNCPNCQTDNCPAGLPAFSLDHFRTVLIRRGIIQPGAVDDPEGYDGGDTMEATRAACEELLNTQNTAGQGAAKPYPAPACSEIR